MSVKYPFAFYFSLLIFSLFCLSCSSLHHQSPAEKLYLEGQSFLVQGKGPAALSCFKQSLALARMDGFQAGIAHNLNEIAIYQTEMQNFVEARKLLTEALGIYRSEGMAGEASKAMNNIANTYIREGKWSEAMNCYGELLAWDRQTANHLGEGITLYNMGLLDGKWLKRPNSAHRRLRAALVIFRKLKATKYIQAVEKVLP